MSFWKRNALSQGPSEVLRRRQELVSELRCDIRDKYTAARQKPENISMQSDAVVWDIINHSFCSYKAKVAKERTFCQNEYNVTGLCIRSACPLANSQYATIREEEGVCYLYQKTAERAHTPKHLWEKIKLPANYTKALELVSGQLEHYPKYLVHRNKQRLTKIHQMIIRMRKLKLKARVRIETTNAKVDKREKRKEQGRG